MAVTTAQKVKKNIVGAPSSKMHIGVQLTIKTEKLEIVWADSGLKRIRTEHTPSLKEKVQTTPVFGRQICCLLS